MSLNPAARFFWGGGGRWAFFVKLSDMLIPHRWVLKLVQGGAIRLIFQKMLFLQLHAQR